MKLVQYKIVSIDYQGDEIVHAVCSTLAEAIARIKIEERSDLVIGLYRRGAYQIVVERSESEMEKTLAELELKALELQILNLKEKVRELEKQCLRLY